MQDCELIVVILTGMITFANVFIGCRYINKLVHEMHNGIYIYDDKLHSHKHLGITGVMIALSLLMFFDMLASGEMQYAFWEHMLYNLACIFIFYPHLVEEK